MAEEQETRRVADALYAAFLAGDMAGMLDQMSDDVEVRFLAQGTFRGLEEVRRFMAFSSGLLTGLEFRIEDLLVDGELACAIWHERALTFAGDPWETHGVDVIRVRDGRVVMLHENNDATLVHRHLPRFAPGEGVK